MIKLMIVLVVIDYSLALPYGENSNKISEKHDSERLGSVMHEGSSGSSLSSGGAEASNIGNFNERSGAKGGGYEDVKQDGFGGGFDRSAGSGRNSNGGGDSNRFGDGVVRGQGGQSHGNGGGGFGNSGSSYGGSPGFGSGTGNLQRGSNNQGYSQGGDGGSHSGNSEGFLRPEVGYTGFSNSGGPHGGASSGGFDRTRPLHSGGVGIEPGQIGSSGGQGNHGVYHGGPSTHFGSSSGFPGEVAGGNFGGAPNGVSQNGFHDNSGLSPGGYGSGFGKPGFGGPGLHFDNLGASMPLQGPYVQGRYYGQGRPYGYGGPHGGYKKYGY